MRNTKLLLEQIFQAQPGEAVTAEMYWPEVSLLRYSSEPSLFVRQLFHFFFLSCNRYMRRVKIEKNCIEGRESIIEDNSLRQTFEGVSFLIHDLTGK